MGWGLFHKTVIVSFLICLAGTSAFSSECGRHLLKKDAQALLKQALREGNLKRVQRHMQRGIDPFHAEGFGETAVSVAVNRGLHKVAKKMYRNRFQNLNFTANFQRQLTLAASQGNLDKVRFLHVTFGAVLLSSFICEDGFPCGLTALSEAVENGHLEIARYLMAHGVNPNYTIQNENMLVRLINHGKDDAKMTELLLQFGCATSQGEVDHLIVRDSFVTEVEVFTEDHSRHAVIYASQLKKLKIAKVLLERKEDWYLTEDVVSEALTQFSNYIRLKI